MGRILVKEAYAVKTFSPDGVRDLIEPPCDAARRRALAHLDQLTKPRGSLGRLEELAAEVIALRRGDAAPFRKKCIVVMAGDHGIVEEGVSAYPQEVTPQMVLNFLRGGAGINVLARRANAEIVIVDIGVASDLPVDPNLISRKIAPGTRNFVKGPAMTRAEAVEAVAIGWEVATRLIADGVDLLGTGEMGIGNTTPSSAIAAVVTGRPLEEITGRGTGIDDAGRARKIAAIRKGIELNRPDPTDGFDVLAKVEIGRASCRERV